MVLFPLGNGVDLVTAIRQTPLANEEKFRYVIVMRILDTLEHWLQLKIIISLSPEKLF